MESFPAWLKHSVNPFFGPGVRRAVAFNLVCPEATDWKPTAVEEPFGRRKFEQSLKKLENILNDIENKSLEIDEMIDFIEKLADISGLPIGIKSAIGKIDFFILNPHSHSTWAKSFLIQMKLWNLSSLNL